LRKRFKKKKGAQTIWVGEKRVIVCEEKGGVKISREIRRKAVEEITTAS